MRPKLIGGDGGVLGAGDDIDWRTASRKQDHPDRTGAYLEPLCHLQDAWAAETGETVARGGACVPLGFRAVAGAGSRVESDARQHQAHANGAPRLPRGFAAFLISRPDQSADRL